jgi:hypothetical protein
MPKPDKADNAAQKLKAAPFTGSHAHVVDNFRPYLESEEHEVAQVNDSH